MPKFPKRMRTTKEGLFDDLGNTEIVSKKVDLIWEIQKSFRSLKSESEVPESDSVSKGLQSSKRVANSKFLQNQKKVKATLFVTAFSVNTERALQKRLSA